MIDRCISAFLSIRQLIFKGQRSYLILISKTYLAIKLSRLQECLQNLCPPISSFLIRLNSFLSISIFLAFNDELEEVARLSKIVLELLWGIFVNLCSSSEEVSRHFFSSRFAIEGLRDWLARSIHVCPVVFLIFRAVGFLSHKNWMVSTCSI